MLPQSRQATKREAQPDAISDQSRSVARVPVLAVNGADEVNRFDEVTAEEPLEIRIVAWSDGRWLRHRIAVTMRTPGHDFELAAGFLFSEGVINDAGTIKQIAYCASLREAERQNIVNVFLARDVTFDPARLSRHVYTTSSCGVCGKTSLELVRAVCPRPPVGTVRLPRDYFVGLPERLRQSQTIFDRTGGLHASALFDAEGRLLLVREDVGRHNAMDKLIGALLQDGRLPASNTVVFVSGRASFELVQKALMAGIPILAAVGAPTSLAVETAKEFGMTLVGFLRGDRLNVYSCPERVLF